MKKSYFTIAFISLMLFGHAQNALDFDGSNDYVQTTYSGVLGTTNRTFEAWIYVGTGVSSNMCIMDYGTNAVGSRNSFSVGSNYQLIFISGGTNANFGSSNNAVAPNQWTHVAFVLNNGTGYLYANGVQVGTGNLSAVNTPTGNTSLRIGQRVSGGSIPFNGIIDEVRVWSVARSASDILSSMNGEYCTIPTGLEVYYKLNSGTAGGTNTGITTATDYVSTNNGTLTNFSLSGSSSNWVTGKSLNTGSNTPSNVSITVCDGYTASNGTVWTTNGNYVDTITSVTGCDSILNIALTVLQSNTGQLSANGCDSYLSPSGNYTWSTSGTYYDTLVNSAGCDSVLTISLTITSIDNYVQQNGAYLTANMTGANYQWLDCNNNYAPISGATNRTYQATANGNYAAEISQNGCSDTSDCYTVTGIGLQENTLFGLQIQPNPARNFIVLTHNSLPKMGHYQIYSFTGKVLAEGEITKNNTEQLIPIDMPAGVYLVRLTVGGASAAQKLIVY